MGHWYWWVPRTPYEWPGCGEDDRAPRLAVHLDPGWSPLFEHTPEPIRMVKHYIHRSWRIAATVGPLAAIALSLAAGMKWR